MESQNEDKNETETPLLPPFDVTYPQSLMGNQNMTRRDEESNIGARTASRKRKRSAETKGKKKTKMKISKMYEFSIQKDVSKFIVCMVLPYKAAF